MSPMFTLYCHTGWPAAFRSRTTADTSAQCSSVSGMGGGLSIKSNGNNG